MCLVTITLLPTSSSLKAYRILSVHSWRRTFTPLTQSKTGKKQIKRNTLAQRLDLVEPGYSTPSCSAVLYFHYFLFAVHCLGSSTELFPQTPSIALIIIPPEHCTNIDQVFSQPCIRVKWRGRIEVCLPFTLIWWIAHLQVFYKRLKGETQKVRNVPVMMHKRPSDVTSSLYQL